jgi:hypothetical protein
VRSLRPILALVLLAAACVTRVEPTGTDVGAVSSAPPPGCERTVCDLAREQCDDPCAQCWKLCGDEATRAGVSACASTCGILCTLAKANKDTLAAECAEAFASCQSTHLHTICVDQLSDAAAENGPPCSHARVLAGCACGPDSSCLGVLDVADPSCRRCNRKWRTQCVATACGTEHEQMIACAAKNRCASVADCAPCAGDVEILAKCVDDAQNDPRDIGGCFSGLRSCWAETECPSLDQ